MPPLRNGNLERLKEKERINWEIKVGFSLNWSYQLKTVIFGIWSKANLNIIEKRERWIKNFQTRETSSVQCKRKIKNLQKSEKTIRIVRILELNGKSNYILY